MAGSNVVSLSGGKDSTAMLLMLLERGEDVADIVFYDTGWEFPQMYEHLVRLEEFTGRKITRLNARIPNGTASDKKGLDWLFADAPVIKRGTSIVHRVGYGWPFPSGRWCAGRKQAALRAHFQAMTYRQDIQLPVWQCIGFDDDEFKRRNNLKVGRIWYNHRFTLIEWEINEKDALAYCRKLGFDWNGLYEQFHRLSCFCCPLQSLDELRALRRNFPSLWKRMLLMESWLPEGIQRRFNTSTVSGLDARFAAEEAI